MDFYFSFCKLGLEICSSLLREYITVLFIILVDGNGLKTKHLELLKHVTL